jgi:hypothetical protein
MARRTTTLAKRDDNPGDEEAARWKHEIEQFEEDDNAWQKRGDDIVLRYRAPMPDGQGGITAVGGFAHSRGYNILWSNVQTLKPSLYSREPVPIAERRFLDKDVVGRAASQILERAMRYEMMDCGFHETVTKCIYDYLLPGRGTAWLRYIPAFGPASSPAEHGDDQLAEDDGEPVDEDGYEDRSPERDEHDESDERTYESQSEKLIGASIAVDYVNWKDFGHTKARTWEEVEAIWRRRYMSRDDLIDNFGKEIGKDVPLDRVPDDKNRSQVADRMKDGLKKATVYEIWCKYDRKVYFVAKGFDRLLEEPKDDPLNLEGFWPCPRPLYATMTNDTLKPIPDFAEYQDQAIELDNLTRRCDALLAALQVRGVYNSANKELARLLDEGSENRMIAIKDWAGFAEKGGLKGAVDFMPIEMIGSTLMELFQAREQIKKDLYEITGLADVIRGQSDPRETAEAVRTKGRFGSMRLQDRQAEVARFCRDIIRMMGEIIAEHFPDQTLIDVSGIMYDEGVGPMMPTPPAKPDEQAQNPMMGHNGGPPMNPAQAGVPGPSGINTAPSGVAAQTSNPVPGGPFHPPQGAAVPPGAMPPPGMPPSPSQGLQPPGSPGAPPSPQQPGMAPPAIPPQLQYAMDMAQYEQKRQAAEIEKQQLVERALGLLRQDKLRGFRIDIETDSTLNQDANEDKAARVEFMTAMSGMLEKGMQAGMADPEIVPLIGKIILFTARGFRAGRDLESAIEEYVDQKEKDAKKSAGQPKPPDPKVQAEQIKAAAEVQKAKTDAQSSADDNQRAMAQKAADAQIAQQKGQMEQQQMAADFKMKEAEHQMQMAQLQLKMQLAERELGVKLQIAEQEHAHKMQASDREHQQQIALAGMNMQATHLGHQQKLEQAGVGHEHKLEAGEMAHEQAMEAAKAQPTGAGA